MKIKIKDLIAIILCLQVALLLLASLEEIEDRILFILRQVVSFICLLFFPGFLLLRCFIRERLYGSEEFVYSIGLSLFFLIAFGVAVNFLYPLIGISQPLSQKLIISTFVSAILVLCIITWKWGNKEDLDISITRYKLPILFSSLFIILAILGTELLYYFSNNRLLLLLFMFISVTPLAVTIKDKDLSLYAPFIIWAYTLSLVFYNSLYGNYMRVTDNVVEYFLLRDILRNKIWDFTIQAHRLNGMAGVMGTLPIYSLISGLNLIWIYKVIVPLLSSLIPIVLFKAFKDQYDTKIAFFSSFFFLSMFNFFTWCSITMKMVSSLIFLSLLILLLCNNRINIRYRKALAIIFTFGLIVSHYGTSYILMIALGISFIMLSIITRKNNYKDNLYLNFDFIAIYITSTLAWYIYTVGGSSFESFVFLGQHFIQSIKTEFLLPADFYTTQILTTHLVMEKEITKYLYMVAFGLMALGLIFALRNTFKERKINEYILISLCALFLLLILHIAGGTQYGCGRAWTILGCFLAPFIMIGCVELSKMLKKVFSRVQHGDSKAGVLVASVFLCLFFLFNSGLAAELIWNNNIGPSIYLSAPRIAKNGTIEEKHYLYRITVFDSEMKSGQWLIANLAEECRVYCDYFARDKLQLMGITHHTWVSGKPIIYNLRENIDPPKNSYIYLSKFNKEMLKGRIVKAHFFPAFFELSESPALNSNRIYTNGGNEIYYR